MALPDLPPPLITPPGHPANGGTLALSLDMTWTVTGSDDRSWGEPHLVQGAVLQASVPPPRSRLRSPISPKTPPPGRPTCDGPRKSSKSVSRSAPLKGDAMAATLPYVQTGRCRKNVVKSRVLPPHSRNALPPEAWSGRPLSVSRAHRPSCACSDFWRGPAADADLRSLGCGQRAAGLGGWGWAATWERSAVCPQP